MTKVDLSNDRLTLVGEKRLMELLHIETRTKKLEKVVEAARKFHKRYTEVFSLNLSVG